jgi:hypothetical protein
MQQEMRGRGDAASPSEGALSDGSVGERPVGVFAAVGPGPVPSVSDVPSDQLWRAAVLAAREAAMTAAELRRSLERRRGG